MFHRGRLTMGLSLSARKAVSLPCLALKAIDITTQVLPPLFTAATIILGVLQPQHNPLKNTISELVLGTGGWLLTIFFLAFGLAYFLFSYRIWITFKGMPHAMAGAVLLTVMGLSFIILAICPTEPGGIGASTTGITHVVAAATGICIFPLAAYCIWKSNAMVRRDAFLHKMTIVTMAAGILLSLGTCAGLLLGAPWKGAVERVMALNGLVWFQAVGYHLWKRHPVAYLNLDGSSYFPRRLRAVMELINLYLTRKAALAAQKHSPKSLPHGPTTHTS